MSRPPARFSRTFLVLSAAAGVTLLALLFFLYARAGASGEPLRDPEAERLLVEYLRIDTSNPPGNETAAARFLAAFLAEEGLETKLVGRDPQRQSLYARLDSGSDEPALLLVHHLDVVPARSAEWTVPPFSGERRGGYIWGRGALDVKSLGIAQLLALVDLKRRNVPLRRDIVLLAVADEERGGLAGMQQILESSPELLDGVGFAINEGGANETVVDSVAFWGIEVDQKVPFWFRLTARDASGHGALPPDGGGAPSKLVRALASIDAIPRPYRLVPSTARYFSALAPSKKGEKKLILENPEAYFGRDDFEKAFPASYRTLLRDSLAITTLSAGDSINSIPPTAVAEVDMRLLPGSDTAEMEKQVRARVGDLAQVEVVLTSTPAPPSPVDTPLYEVLRRSMSRASPGSVVGPMVSPGTSDSRFLRSRGIVTYGISPFKVNYYDADTIHGVDERIRIHFFVEGVRLMKEIVREFCAQPER